MKNVLLTIMVLSLCGCQMAKNLGRAVVSSTTGISRNITLYAADGQVIRGWQTKSSINDEGAVVCFYDSQGRAIQVAGTVVVEQIN